MKLQNMKLTDQMTGHEIEGYEIAGHENAGHEIFTRYVNLNSGFGVLDDQQCQPTTQMSKIKAEWALSSSLCLLGEEAY